MSAHTPGPWFVRYCDDDSFMCMTAISAVPVPPRNCEEYTDRSPDDMVAIVYHQLQPYVRPDDPDTANANARLIACSPELLAMVKQYASECGECDGTGVWTSVDGDEEVCEFCSDIRELIAKATTA